MQIANPLPWSQIYATLFPNDYSKIARIERAKVLLYTTNESATQIADRLHFCSGSYFAREFKKFTGQTPAEYRAENTK